MRNTCPWMPFTIPLPCLRIDVARCARMMARMFIAVANEVLKKLSKNYKSFAVEELLANRFVVASGL
jgi:phosphoribosylcarboxyaminoimidazole (NCAIR) mutase